MIKRFRSRGIVGVGLVGVVMLCVTLAGCGGGQSSGQTSTGASSVISGVSSATLTWDAPNQDLSGACINVASYQINYGTSATNLSQTATVPAGSVSCTDSGTTNACGPIQSCTYPVAKLPAGTWYFTVQVTDTSGQHSGDSSVASDSVQ